MDKELPESALGIKPPKSYIRVSKSNLPGYKGYKASVIFRSTIGIETIAERIVKKRNVYGKETLVTAFNIIKNEIYEAIEEGFNVDFGFGRTEITASGSFESLGEKFNRKKHTLTPCLRPSPQLKRHASRSKTSRRKRSPMLRVRPMSASRSNLALLTAPNLTISFLPDAIRSSRSTAAA